MTTTSRSVVLFSVIGSMVAGAGSIRAQGVQQLIVVPTLANDHQVDLDYTVAHLEALLDGIEPDAILVDDYSDWLANGCLWQATSPENHVALRYATAAGIPIFGTFLRTAPTAYDGAMRTEERYRTVSIDDGREAFRPRLDRTAAAIARDYWFAVPSARLDRLLSVGFAAEADSWTPQMRAGVQRRTAVLADSIRSRMREHPVRSRRVALLWWGYTLSIGDSLRARGDIGLTSVQRFLPIEESYTVTPYSGMPDEAFRHFPLKAGVPDCAPKRQ